MNRYSALGKFPHVKAHYAEQLCSVEASNWHTAASRAVEEFLSRPGVKGKQLDSLTITLRLMPAQPAEPSKERHDL